MVDSGKLMTVCRFRGIADGVACKMKRLHGLETRVACLSSKSAGGAVHLSRTPLSR